MKQSKHLEAARAVNPRNLAAAARYEARYRDAACCARCHHYDAGKCNALRCGVKRTTLCDRYADAGAGTGAGGNA